MIGSGRMLQTVWIALRQGRPWTATTVFGRRHNPVSKSGARDADGAHRIRLHKERESTAGFWQTCSCKKCRLVIPVGN